MSEGGREVEVNEGGREGGREGEREVDEGGRKEEGGGGVGGSTYDISEEGGTCG